MAARTPMASIALATLILVVAAAVTQAADAGDKINHGGNGDIRPRSGDLVVEVCKNFSQGDLLGPNKSYFNEETCISVLRSDNRSTTAKDYGDLVVIAMDLLSRPSNEVAGKVGEVLRNHGVQNSTKQAFRHCDADYGFVIKILPVCRDMFLDLKPQGKQADRIDAMMALDCIDRLGLAAGDCLFSLTMCKDYTQTTHEFQKVVKHATLAWGLMEMALNYKDDDPDW